MSFQPIELSMVVEGHGGTFRAWAADEGGWEVHAELEEGLVVFRHCSDWQAVERTRIWLDAWMHQRANRIVIAGRSVA